MGLALRRLYVDFLRQRYQQTKSRKVRALILDQLCRDIEKIRVGAKHKRKHSEPMTPFERAYLSTQRNCSPTQATLASITLTEQALSQGYLINID
jgi:hypothetical protein